MSPMSIAHATVVGECDAMTPDDFHEYQIRRIAIALEKLSGEAATAAKILTEAADYWQKRAEKLREYEQNDAE